jgi:hypothetical protein
LQLATAAHPTRCDFSGARSCPAPGQATRSGEAANRCRVEHGFERKVEFSFAFDEILIKLLEVSVLFNPDFRGA